MVAYAVHETGVREVIGLDVGEVESGSFWVEFLRGLKRRGLAGVRLAITDQHEGLKSAVARVLACPWQRCTVHFTRDMVMHCRRDQRGLVAAALREIFQAENGPAAKERVTSVLDRLASVAPKVCELLEQAEEDLTAFTTAFQFRPPNFPRLQWRRSAGLPRLPRRRRRGVSGGAQDLHVGCRVCEVRSWRDQRRGVFGVWSFARAAVGRARGAAVKSRVPLRRRTRGLASEYSRLRIWPPTPDPVSSLTDGIYAPGG